MDPLTAARFGTVQAVGSGQLLRPEIQLLDQLVVDEVPMSVGLNALPTAQRREFGLVSKSDDEDLLKAVFAVFIAAWALDQVANTKIF